MQATPVKEDDLLTRASQSFFWTRLDKSDKSDKTSPNAPDTDEPRQPKHLPSGLSDLSGR
ncbi:hypothetical protein EEB11_01990 [Pseudotabrizicola sediminis]|uniref:Uncharacterized protein n=1 Tax=Pseudotabrizicola sediminis TaxID=2486418 RepID=A0ABY2KSS0_9RHOB|nr:hypothetical protein EEB11_01990 [Pseudotabrizicola sediminis]